MTKFVSAEKQPRYAKVLLLGNAGKGKTRSMLSFPKPVVVDSEGGTGWFADKFQFQVAHTKSVSEVKSLLDDIQRGVVHCETICIDSLTSFHNTLLSAGGKRTQDGSLSMREWGVLKKEERLLMDRLYLLPFHVVCTGWLKEEYAKPGDMVNGQKVGQNELVKIGETIDFDKKALHAFDFIFKLDTDDKAQFFATCMKARGDRFKYGQRIQNLSWASLAPLFAGVGDDMAGQSEEDASEQDADLFSKARPSERDSTAPAASRRDDEPISPPPATQPMPEAPESPRAAITFKARGSLNALIADQILTPSEIARVVESAVPGKSDFSELEFEDEARKAYKALQEAKRAVSTEPIM